MNSPSEALGSKHTRHKAEISPCSDALCVRWGRAFSLYSKALKTTPSKQRKGCLIYVTKYLVISHYVLSFSHPYLLSQMYTIPLG